MTTNDDTQRGADGGAGRDESVRTWLEKEIREMDSIIAKMKPEVRAKYHEHYPRLTLQRIDDLTSRLAAAERERDVLVAAVRQARARSERYGLNVILHGADADAMWKLAAHTDPATP